MFDSGISAKDIIKMVQSEADVALPIPDETYIDWINTLEQFLYTGIIHEQDIIRCSTDDVSEHNISIDDIYSIYTISPKLQLSKCNPIMSLTLNDVWWIDNNKIYTKSRYDTSSVNIVYWVKPPLKTMDNNYNIAIPLAFIDMVKAKLRAEAYLIENESVLASNWMAIYNTQLEYFKEWVQQRASQIGM